MSSTAAFSTFPESEFSDDRQSTSEVHEVEVEPEVNDAEPEPEVTPEVVTCKGTKGKDKSPCARPAKENGFCGYHNPNKPPRSGSSKSGSDAGDIEPKRTCKGIVAKGKDNEHACTKEAKKDSDYCGIHNPNRPPRAKKAKKVKEPTEEAPKELCKGTKGKDHVPCDKVAKENGYCGYHNPDKAASDETKPKCTGTKKDGTECTKNASEGSQFCHLHDPVAQETAKANIVLCTATKKNGNKCDKKAKKGTILCSGHTPKKQDPAAILDAAIELLYTIDLEKHEELLVRVTDLFKTAGDLIGAEWDLPY